MEQLSFENILVLIILGTIFISLLFVIGLMIIDSIIEHIIFNRDNPKFRVIEHARLNSLSPPGNKKFYSIEGHLFCNIWINLKFFLFGNDNYYGNVQTAKFVIDYYKFNAINNQWKYTDEFNNIISVLKNNYKVKKKTLMTIGLDRDDDNHYIVNDKKQIWYKSKYKLYKKYGFIWVPILGTYSYDELDKKLRAYNTIKKTTILETY